MPTLIERLDNYDPQWRRSISADPLEAAVEIGLLEPEELDGEEHAELDFN
jgi:hypothetical protein